MYDPNMTLVYLPLIKAVEELAEDPSSASAWATARQTLEHHGVTADDDSELDDCMQLEDSEGLSEIVAGWTSGSRLMLVRDRDVLKRAMKAFRKTLKVTILAAETTLGGGPMSTGRKSDIVGVVPPERYPAETWDELVRQKRLSAEGHGIYGLPEGG